MQPLDPAVPEQSPIELTRTQRAIQWFFETTRPMFPEKWCADGSRWWWLADALFVECACCFMLRALTLGFFTASCLWGAVAIAWIML